MMRKGRMEEKQSIQRRRANWRAEGGHPEGQKLVSDSVLMNIFFLDPLCFASISSPERANAILKVPLRLSRSIMPLLSGGPSHFYIKEHKMLERLYSGLCVILQTP